MAMDYADSKWKEHICIYYVSVCIYVVLMQQYELYVHSNGCKMCIVYGFRIESIIDFFPIHSWNVIPVTVVCWFLSLCECSTNYKQIPYGVLHNFYDVGILGGQWSVVGARYYIVHSL